MQENFSGRMMDNQSLKIKNKKSHIYLHLIKELLSAISINNSILFSTRWSSLTNVNRLSDIISFHMFPLLFAGSLVSWCTENFHRQASQVLVMDPQLYTNGNFIVGGKFVGIKIWRTWIQDNILNLVIHYFLQALIFFPF